MSTSCVEKASKKITEVTVLYPVASVHLRGCSRTEKGSVKVEHILFIPLITAASCSRAKILPVAFPISLMKKAEQCLKVFRPV